MKKIKEFRNKDDKEEANSYGKFVGDKTCIISMGYRIMIVDVDTFTVKK